MNCALKKSTIYFILLYLSISSLLSIISGNVSFLIFSLIYISFANIAGMFIHDRSRNEFISIFHIFISLYTVYAVFSYFILYDNPLIDHIGDIDQIYFLRSSLYLATYSYGEIWKISFTAFEYHESPLFYAFIGSIQKLSGLDIYYGALFLKLNTVFFSSLILSFLYLIIKELSKSNQLAWKWTIIYGIFSFLLYYSSIILRDIHITLLYTISFYIIIKRRRLFVDYIFLLMICVCSYFLRAENGLYAVIFTVLWIFYYSIENKLKLLLMSTPLVILLILNFSGIFNAFAIGFNTIISYGERGMQLASSDSLGVVLSQLPIPFNWIGMFGFSQIAPFPFWSIFEDSLQKNVFQIPRAVATLFWIFVWVHMLLHIRILYPYIQEYKWIILFSILYILFVSQGQVYERRIFYVYPFLFSLFTLVSHKNIYISIFRSIQIYMLLSIIYIAIKIS